MIIAQNWRLTMHSNKDSVNTPYFCRKTPDPDIKHWGKKPLDLASKEEVRQLLMNPSVGSPKYEHRKKQNMWRLGRNEVWWALHHFRLRTSTDSQELKKKKTSTTNKNKNTAQRVFNWMWGGPIGWICSKIRKHMSCLCWHIYRFLSHKHFTYLSLETSKKPASVSGCPKFHGHTLCVGGNYLDWEPSKRQSIWGWWSESCGVREGQGGSRRMSGTHLLGGFGGCALKRSGWPSAPFRGALQACLFNWIYDQQAKE